MSRTDCATSCSSRFESCSDSRSASAASLGSTPSSFDISSCFMARCSDAERSSEPTWSFANLFRSLSRFRRLCSSSDFSTGSLVCASRWRSSSASSNSCCIEPDSPFCISSVHLRRLCWLWLPSCCSCESRLNRSRSFSFPSFCHIWPSDFCCRLSSLVLAAFSAGRILLSAAFIPSTACRVSSETSPGGVSGFSFALRVAVSSREAANSLCFFSIVVAASTCPNGSNWCRNRNTISPRPHSPASCDSGVRKSKGTTFTGAIRGARSSAEVATSG